MSEVTTCAGTLVNGRSEEEVVRVDGITVRRSRPIVASGARTVERRHTVAIASGRKEDGVASSMTLYVVAINTIHRCPLPSALIDKFLHFVRGRHAPITAPIRRCSIVGGSQVAFSTDDAARLQF